MNPIGGRKHNHRPSSPAAHAGDAGYAVAMLPEGEQAGPSVRFSTGSLVEMVGDVIVGHTCAHDPASRDRIRAEAEPFNDVRL